MEIRNNPSFCGKIVYGENWDDMGHLFTKQVKNTIRVAPKGTTLHFDSNAYASHTASITLQGPHGKTIDQISEVVRLIKTNPDSRRIIVSAWNVGEIDKMALPPCHVLFQFYVADNKLSCQLYQRSADIFIGVPFNIASYALLTMMIAQVCGLQYGDFVHTFGDAHLYSNHLDQTRLQLTRQPHELPEMKINPSVKDIFSFHFEDFELTGYNPDPHIKADVAV